MPYGDRKSQRVDFERGIHVYIMGIDGTWRRDCMMIDVSQTGARLCIEGSLEGLDLKEFFLLLSSTGLAYRRCNMVRVAGDQIGVQFQDRDTVRKKPQKRQPYALRDVGEGGQQGHPDGHLCSHQAGQEATE
jgi:PilZ domain.